MGVGHFSAVTPVKRVRIWVTRLISRHLAVERASAFAEESEIDRARMRRTLLPFLCCVGLAAALRPLVHARAQEPARTRRAALALAGRGSLVWALGAGPALADEVPECARDDAACFEARKAAAKANLFENSGGAAGVVALLALRGVNRARTDADPSARSMGNAMKRKKK